MTLLEPGSEVDGYRIERVLGRGGMAVVYEATQSSLGRSVALKLLAQQLSENPAFVERFRREARVQAALEHRNIVPVYDSGESPQGLYLAMRLVRGQSLKQLLAIGPYDPESGVALLEQIAAALDVAHEVGLIHRDVKPQNVLVEDGVAYLADFGLTKTTEDRGLTMQGGYVGSPEYLSPEQIDPTRGPLSPRSDVYSFAVVLFECLSGRVPFRYDTLEKVLYAHVHEPPPPLSRHARALPPALDAVLAKGLAKAPEERYALASELVGEARAALADTEPASDAGGGGWRSGHTIADRLPAQIAPAADAPARRPRWPFVTAALALLALVAGAGFLVGDRGSGADREPASVAIAGPLVLRFPEDWRLALPVSIPGLALENPVGLAWREEAAPARLTAGIAPKAEGELVLPGAFVAGLPSPPRAETVRLGNLPALLYRQVRHAEHDRPLTLYVVQTSGGAAIVVCESGASEGLARCEAVASTLSLRGVRARGLEPSRAYGNALDEGLRVLVRVRAKARSTLATARTQQAQRSAAVQLAFAYRHAKAAVEKARPGAVERPAHRALIAALDSAAAAHAGLGAAAQRNDAAAFDRAAATVRGAESAVRAALGRLGLLGYRIVLPAGAVTRP